MIDPAERTKPLLELRGFTVDLPAMAAGCASSTT